MRHLLLFLYLLVLLPVFSVLGQVGSSEEEQKRLVYFTDKESSPFSLARPLEFLSPASLARRERQHISLTNRDLPVNPAYVAALQEAGIAVWYTSRWFNAAVVQGTAEKLSEMESFPFVKSSRTLNKFALPSSKEQLGAVSSSIGAAPLPGEEEYGAAYHQANMLGADKLHAAGYRGAGLTIAVLDAGFPAVNTIPALAHLYQNGKLKGTYDFVQKQEDVYGASSHGTSVLSTMAAYEPGKMIGTAYEANYLLLRTEDAATEHNIEEINWLLAAEYADSAGADVINSSLGYTTFDTPSTSYTYSDMNGDRALVSQAADFAASTGMLVVVSAGNDGSKSWKYISAPADADSVLTVGAVDSAGVKASFSAFGPTADGQIKPDVVALGQKAYVLSTTGQVVQSNGTSFSGPIMAGFMACLWQANKEKTNMEMIGLVRQISSNAGAPDNNTGYGIPDYSRILTALPQLPTGKTAYISNPVRDQPIVLTLGQEWWQQALEVQVLDATGKLVHRQSFPAAGQEQVLDVQAQQLSSGLYLCRLRAGSRMTTLRFIKL
ncbi:putative secreted protein (Por secretion system target) [Pontibacter ummariensis]|uniref:Por secretion system C-terminal sorting domain-containing protein n=1 Tax=Pontibacter ummariensis TaxID=1610492 RepID=A0A239BZV7_9BACT|nr:S8 family serine peptidase [Pontibacter ummariensis]PRY15559.1 putative secreted protein (Por secretion system target) [Pontibacter ummariensis]SNS12674.1 Por secretion system C-terminal sorting domain-containing protein [Pontibacter ummariensis]